ncbi:hypothetical protein ACFL0Y_01400 [Patescibacteria group bacterium]
MVVLSKTILILEDDLRVLSKLLEKLSILEQDQPYDLSVISLTNYKQVQNFINSNPKAQFDIVLLDRDCKIGGSFHVFDIEQFGADKIISISSVPEYNKEARKRGVKRIILKDFKYLDKFVDQVIKEIERMLRKTSLLSALKKVHKS